MTSHLTPLNYAGIHDDERSGLTHLGRIVRDAWVFELLPESESCAGWNAARMQQLYEQVYAAWEPYGHLPSRLPEPLRTRHAKLYAQAIDLAKERGWNPEMGEDD